MNRLFLLVCTLLVCAPLQADGRARSRGFSDDLVLGDSYGRGRSSGMGNESSFALDDETLLIGSWKSYRRYAQDTPKADIYLDEIDKALSDRLFGSDASRSLASPVQLIGDQLEAAFLEVLKKDPRIELNDIQMLTAIYDRIERADFRGRGMLLDRCHEKIGMALYLYGRSQYSAERMAELLRINIDSLKGIRRYMRTPVQNALITELEDKLDQIAPRRPPEASGWGFGWFRRQ